MKAIFVSMPTLIECHHISGAILKYSLIRESVREYVDSLKYSSVIGVFMLLQMVVGRGGASNQLCPHC